MPTDALIGLLSQNGYQPILLPMTGLKPPELYNLVRKPRTRLVRRGPLLDYLPPSVRKVIEKRDLFEIESGEVAKIEGKQTTGKNIKGAANFLSMALSCIGIDGAPKLDLSFAGGRELTFSFSGVTFQRVDPSKIEEVIQELETHAIDERYVSQGRLHIVYEYIFSRELNLQRSDSARFEHDISAANLGHFLDVGTKGKVEAHGEARISFSASSGQPAAFACKAGRLERDKEGRWSFYPEEVMLSGTTSVKTPYIPAEGEILPVEQAAD